MRWALLVLAIWLSALAVTIPAAAQELDPGHPGRRMAFVICSNCHKVDPGERGGPVRSFQELADDDAITELSLRVFFQTPHRNMPQFQLTEAQTAAMIEYILSMKPRR
jgi:mono/diheme cytochrome c family protein